MLYPRRTPIGAHVPYRYKYLLDQVMSSLNHDRVIIARKGLSTSRYDDAIAAVRELYKYLT